MLKKELILLNSQYEEELTSWKSSYDREIFCKKGCPTCCDMPVSIDISEAVVLADSLTQAQYSNVVEHAQMLFNYACNTTSKEDYLFKYRRSMKNACPFLDMTEGSCSIHEFRPVSCRSVYSNMPPEYCSKDMSKFLENPDKKKEFMSFFDPRVNWSTQRGSRSPVPYITPLQNIFIERYQTYFLMLNIKYFNYILSGEMSFLITLAKNNKFMRTVINGKLGIEEFKNKLQGIDLYHKNLIAHCQEAPLDIKSQIVNIELSELMVNDALATEFVDDEE